MVKVGHAGIANSKTDVVQGGVARGYKVLGGFLISQANLKPPSLLR
jgi:hypothetical protein